MQTSLQKSMKTPKGTVLPLLNLKGKDYLQVMHRLVWFNEEKASWSILTDLEKDGDTFCIVKATLLDEKGNMRFTARKREDKAHFADYMEKAETGAIGRALALAGYGTQFAPELDEEDRIVDSPAPARTAPTAAATAGARRPIGPPPQGARPGTVGNAAKAAPATRTTSGPAAPKTASPSEKKSDPTPDFPSFR